MAVVDASKKVVDELRARAAMIWDVDVEGVIWEDGQAKPASSNVGDFAPLPFKELAAIHRRLAELPMSPPKVRAALDQGQAD
jgi:hypothetical protein